VIQIRCFGRNRYKVAAWYRGEDEYCGCVDVHFVWYEVKKRYVHGGWGELREYATERFRKAVLECLEMSETAPRPNPFWAKDKGPPPRPPSLSIPPGFCRPRKINTYKVEYTEKWAGRFVEALVRGLVLHASEGDVACRRLGPLEYELVVWPPKERYRAGGGRHVVLSHTFTHEELRAAFAAGRCSAMIDLVIPRLRGIVMEALGGMKNAAG
jgi:hypothetical protein